MVKFPDIGGSTKLYFVDKGDGSMVNISDHIVPGSLRFGFDPAEKEEESVSEQGATSCIDHEYENELIEDFVIDLMDAIPDLRKSGEHPLEFAWKVRRSAEFNRGLDADTDLISRLHTDSIYEVSEKRNEKEGQ